MKKDDFYEWQQSAIDKQASEDTTIIQAPLKKLFQAIAFVQFDESNTIHIQERSGCHHSF
jgi:hypothetical protein